MKNYQQNPTSERMPTVRIAPVCNGKVFVVPHHSADGEISHWDLPIAEAVESADTVSVKTVKRLTEKYRPHVRTKVHPRFSVKYTSKADKQAVFYLYVLPLEKEDDIRFRDGQFVTPDEINADRRRFSPNLYEESELLAMAAELWADYYATVTVEG